MKVAINDQDFEKAAKIRDEIKDLKSKENFENE